MDAKHAVSPESSAVRVALWRALHILVDQKPSILNDDVGIKLIAPEENWRSRQDMDPEFTKLFRASIVVRSRFIEDLVSDQNKKGTSQYVILGAGIDTFAQRKPASVSGLQIYEVDQPGPQEWKKQRLKELGYGIPSSLHFVPVDFEAGKSWPVQLEQAGFDKNKPALVSSTGVSMYLTKEANLETLRSISKLAPGSTLAMTFLLPIEMAPPEEKMGFELSAKGARASGTPFISFFTPEEMVALAREAGFKRANVVTGHELNQKYFQGRNDGLKTGMSEAFLIAGT